MTSGKTASINDIVSIFRSVPSYKIEISITINLLSILLLKMILTVAVKFRIYVTNARISAPEFIKKRAGLHYAGPTPTLRNNEYTEKGLHEPISCMATGQQEETLHINSF